MDASSSDPLNSYVFLSYASEDRVNAEAIRSELERIGIDVIPWDQVLTPGRYWAAQIGHAIESADTFVVLLSKAATKSEWVQFEIAAAIAAEAKSDDKKVIPIILEPGTRPPALLAPYLAIETSKPEEVGSVAEALKRVLTETPKRADKARERDAARQQLDSLRTALEDEQTRYDTVMQRKQSRAVIAIVMVTLLAATVGATFAVSSGKLPYAVLSSLVASLVAVISTAVGYYFGSRSREH
jgi:hypothetical protein